MKHTATDDLKHSLDDKFSRLRACLQKFSPVWTVTTFYSLVFLAGIFLGELVTDFSRIAVISNIISTLIVLVLGLDVIWKCWHKNSFVFITAAGLILANFMDFATMFEPPIIRIFFHMATVLAACVLFYLVHFKKILDN